MSSRHQNFVEYLMSLHERDDRGALAHLRRGLGKPLGSVVDMFPYIVPWTHDLFEAQANMYYLVAALFAYHPMNTDNGNFGDTCLQISHSARSKHSKAQEGEQDKEKGKKYDTPENDSLTKHFMALLNAHVDDLDVHLRRMIALAKSNDIPVNWAQLLDDICKWDHPERYIQRRWANAYWKGYDIEHESE